MRTRKQGTQWRHAQLHFHLGDYMSSRNAFACEVKKIINAFDDLVGIPVPHLVSIRDPSSECWQTKASNLELNLSDP